MGKQTFIEINGKKYDAVTGRLIGDESSGSVAKATTIQPAQNSGVMDGFVKRPRRPVERTTASSTRSTQTQKSKTLMRKSVQKPGKITKDTKHHQPSQLKKKLGQSPRRTQQAQTVSRSPHISKYEHPAARSSVVKKQSSLSVKELPAAVAPPTAKAAPVAQAQAHSTNGANTTKQKLLEKALANADAHTQSTKQSHKKKRKSFAKRIGVSSRAVAVSSAVLAAVLLGGFFALQNVPNFAMRVAATRAGFDATMPGYQPAGFSFRGPINYSSGSVTVSFKSNSDGRHYDFVQRSSNWNSDALLANFIIAEDKMYQTYLDKGRTLYIYEGSNATWVDNGIWYQIEGDSGMTTDQLIRIASSV